MSVDWKMGDIVYYVDANPVAAFHQDVEVGSQGVTFDPARVVVFGRCLDGAYVAEFACYYVLLLVSRNRVGAGYFTAYPFMTPYLISPHISGIQVLLLGIEHHAVNSRILVQFCILDVFLKKTL